MFSFIGRIQLIQLYMQANEHIDTVQDEKKNKKDLILVDEEGPNANSGQEL